MHRFVILKFDYKSLERKTERLYIRRFHNAKLQDIFRTIKNREEFKSY